MNNQSRTLRCKESNVSEFYGSEEVVIKSRPLEPGTRLKYYNHERMMEVEAKVRSAGVFFLWVVDVQEPPPDGPREHYIVYSDITSIMDVPNEQDTR